jgi:hypothetical protein
MMCKFLTLTMNPFLNINMCDDVNHAALVLHSAWITPFFTVSSVTVMV